MKLRCAPNAGIRVGAINVIHGNAKGISSDRHISDQASSLKNHFNEAGHQQKKEAMSSMGWQYGMAVMVFKTEQETMMSSEIDET
jgi:hypothetical protein